MKKIIFISFLLIIVVLLGWYAPERSLNYKKEYTSIPELSIAAPSLLNDEPKAKNIFLPPEIEAKAAMVLDVKTDEIIFEKNSMLQLPLASITKLMTAVTIHEILKEREVEFKALVRITSNALAQEGDDGLFLDELFRIEDLIDIILIASSNDAAYALAEHLGSLDAFVVRMNEQARIIGLHQSYFLNPTGLDFSETLAGAYGSAKDVAHLIKWTVENHPKILFVTQEPEKTFVSFQGFEHTFENTNELVTYLPQLVGGKTGFEDLAGGNLAVIVDLGFEHPVIIVVLGSTEEGRFEDVRKLYNSTLQWFFNS